MPFGRRLVMNRSKLVSELTQELEYLIRQAEYHKTFHFCEACYAFIPKRRCKYRHRKRYWTLEQFTKLYEKLKADQALDLQDAMLMEVLQAKQELRIWFYC